MADDCYAPNEAMKRLSALRSRHSRQHWLIETALIELSDQDSFDYTRHITSLGVGVRY